MPGIFTLVFLVFYVVFQVFILLTLSFFVKQEIEVVRTTVGEFTNDDIVLNIYVDNEQVEVAPKKGAGYEFDQISCDNEAEGTWNSGTWWLLVTKITGKTKCNIYFKKIVTKLPDIIAILDTTGKCPTVNDDGSVRVIYDGTASNPYKLESLNKDQNDTGGTA